MFKLSIQQPSLAHYRVSLYEALKDYYDITIYYGVNDIVSVLPKGVSTKYSRLYSRKLFGFTFKWHNAQLLAVNKKSDVVILSWDVQYFTLWLAIIKSKFYRKPVILWGHGFSKNEHPFKWKIRLIPTYFCKAIILYDFQTAEAYKGIKSVAHKVFVAPNSLDQIPIQRARQIWNGDSTRLVDFRQKHGIDSTFNLIYIGRIYKENKLEILLKAVRLAVKEIAKLRLIVIGDGKEYFQEVIELARSYGIQNNILWVGPLYKEEEIAPWMMSSHIFCYPSNIGLSIMHAFGYGLPVVTDNALNEHNPEIWSLEDGFNGLLYEKDSPVDLVDKVLALYKNSDEHKRLSGNAFSTVLNKYNMKNMTEGFKNAIEYSAS